MHVKATPIQRLSPSFFKKVVSTFSSPMGVQPMDDRLFRSSSLLVISMCQYCHHSETPWIQFRFTPSQLFREFCVDSRSLWRLNLWTLFQSLPLDDSSQTLSLEMTKSWIGSGFPTDSCNCTTHCVTRNSEIAHLLLVRDVEIVSGDFSCAPHHFLPTALTRFCLATCERSVK